MQGSCRDTWSFCCANITKNKRYTLNLCIIHISVVPYNQNIKKRSLNAQDNTKDRKGIQIPKDIQIIGFDDNLASRESNPALTTIHQEAPLRAKTAIKCLEAMRDGAECETEIVLPVELIKRESTRKL